MLSELPEPSCAKRNFGTQSFLDPQRLRGLDTDNTVIAVRLYHLFCSISQKSSFVNIFAAFFCIYYKKNYRFRLRFFLVVTGIIERLMRYLRCVVQIDEYQLKRGISIVCFDVFVQFEKKHLDFHALTW